MNQQREAYIGLDVHKDSITIGIAECGRDGEVRCHGTIKGDLNNLTKTIERIAKKYTVLHLCYEAGPCGYAVYRHMTSRGYNCIVVAPSLIPNKPGDRVKTDRRDAVNLAKLHRAGELTAVWVPDTAHEAMRDLVRARTATMQRCKALKQQLLGFLLRHGRIYKDGGNWTQKHRKWLSMQRFAEPAQQIVLEEYIRSIDHAQEQEQRIIQQIRELLPKWALAPVVEALQAMRGVAFIVAVTFVAEVGDITRFDNPKQLMAYLGLVPSEYSSGNRVLRGGITCMGNKEARRVLVEGAWTYAHHAFVNPTKRETMDALPEPVRDIAWKAQTRLAGKYRKLRAKGKPINVINIAIAREMTGFMWDIARHVMPQPAPLAA